MSLRYLLRGQLRYMASKGIEVHAASSDGPEVQNVKEFEGVPHRIFGLTRSITPLKDLLAIISLASWLRKEKFDVVHSHTPKAGLIAMFAAFLAGTKVRMHTVAGIPWMESQGFKRKLLKNVDRLIYKLATHVYPNSFQLERFMNQEKLAPAGKLKVIGNGSSNGINTDEFSPTQVAEDKSALRQQFGLPQDAFVFVFIGRVVNDKGMGELAQAFSQMPPNCYLVLVGPLEPELDPISEEAQEFFETSDNVKMVGYQNDVRPYLKASDALVFPSYREGFPNVPLQAGALGLPSIVTNINGCNEIIVEEENGLLIPTKDAEALEKAMKRFISEPALFEKMAASARPMVVTRFQQEQVWNEIHEEYLSLVN